MIQWECEITARREDGSWRWRRSGATEPNGWIPPEIVPGTVSVGSVVLIEFVNEGGRNIPVACRLRDALAAPDVEDVPIEPRPAPEAPAPAPGHLFLTNIMNPLENENAEGKLRPAVLVSRAGDSWRVMGLTTKPKYSTGEPRRPIPNFQAVGLWGPGFIWGNRLTRVSAESIRGYIGVADFRLVEEIIDIAKDDLSNSEIDDLRSVTRPAVQQARAKPVTSPNATAPQLRLDAVSLLQHLSANSGQVRGDLEDYFLRGSYTGRHFERFSRSADARSFDGNNVAAVMCLGVRLETNVPSALLSVVVEPTIAESSTPIWMRPVEDYLPGSEFHLLHDQLTKIENVGPTIASKLLASKFPHAVPVWDRDVSALLGRPVHWWLGWHDAMQNGRLRSNLVSLRNEMGLENVSVLRIIDVVLWMEAQRRKKSGLL